MEHTSKNPQSIYTNEELEWNTRTPKVFKLKFHLSLILNMFGPRNQRLQFQRRAHTLLSVKPVIGSCIVSSSFLEKFGLNEMDIASANFHKLDR
jgi:hypothetical protein